MPQLRRHLDYLVDIVETVRPVWIVFVVDANLAAFLSVLQRLAEG
jgi:hypothetical protein